MTEQPILDSGTESLVRQRLAEQAAALGAAAQRLDADRRACFGGIATALVSSCRIRTEHQCVPRDLVRIGDRHLLGCEVVLGLKSRTSPADVFVELATEGDELRPVPLSLLADAQFERDFAELFQYYREARLLHLRTTDRHLLMVFQAGSRASDIKVLRWALEGAGAAQRLRYLDNRGERDYVFPPSHDFTWTRTTREQHIQGPHPHINIQDEIFVECVHGDLTVKIEDNTATGQGVYREPVDDPTQGLDDAEWHFAVLEAAILVKVRPYREKAWRHLVYNRRTREVVRLDAIGQSCQQLPEGHGLVFPGGYWLADGTLKSFPLDAAGLEFKRTVRSPAGEDVAYVFYRRDGGAYLILGYNLIAREVSQPLAAHSWCRHDDGRVLLLRAEAEPTRVHTVQVWQTPFCGDEHWAELERRRAAEGGDSLLRRLGNRELVRAVSDLTRLRRLAEAPPRDRAGYDELQAAAARAADAYPWLGDAACHGLRPLLGALRAAATAALDEFEKLAALAAAAAERTAAVAAEGERLRKEVALGDRAALATWVAALTRLRRLRGEAASLRSLRGADPAALDVLEARLRKDEQEWSRQAVEFLRGEEALAAYRRELDALAAEGAAAATAAAAAPLLERLEAQADGLDQLVALVNGLDIADASERTAILERIAEVYAQAGRARALTANRRRELGAGEARSQFAVQALLLSQAVANALGQCATPEACDEQAARLMAQLEELEGRFGEYPEFGPELAARRVEVSEAFAARRAALAEERARRADGLAAAAERILATVARRVQQAASLDDLNAYLAGDPLVGKLAGLGRDLRALGATVRADELDGRLKAAREQGLRQLRDRGSLIDESGLVRLGRHRFSVNPVAPAVALVPRHDGGATALVAMVAGTGYERAVDDPRAVEARHLWDQTLESEGPEVYRGEWLAWLALATLDQDGAAAAAADHEALLAAVRRHAGAELGIERGVHDHDAARILAALLHLRAAGGLLRFTPAARAAAQLAWAARPDAVLAARLRSLAALRAAVGPVPAWQAAVGGCAALLAPGAPAESAAYLAEELALAAPPCFVRSAEAAALTEGFAAWLAQGTRARDLDAGLDALGADPGARFELALAWVGGWAGRERPELAAAAPEAAAALAAPALARATVSARTVLAVEGLLGSHARIRDGRLEVRLDEISARLGAWERERVPEFRAWQRTKQELVRLEEERLRLSELRPEVLTSFVRNRLVDEVFLPLIGDNLAKQIGAAGGGGRTDRQGLLLLLSPPGYGKTTLMEWLAATLGLALVKVNGPAIGHAVTSLDPAEAGNAAARREVERINLALAMGDNVMLYLDDIQHLGSELLQKFIPLCDGTRRIEGVWEGRPRTADLRGRRFAVVMAGNPYTETGERFRLPDMLANRADVYNLGDIIGGARAQFELSYLENCLVANPVLAPLAGRPPADFARLLRLAEGDEGARAELEHPYTATEVGEITAVLRHLRIVQGMLLLVNQAYIASSQQAEGDRTEPPCKVQGSYRTMGKLAAKVVPAMTPAEVRQLVLDLYRQESQTLTSGAEASYLKAKSLFGLLSAEESARWEELCRGFRRRQELMGGKDDPASLAVVQLAKLAEALERMRGHLAQPRPDPLPAALAGLVAAVERAGSAVAAARAEPAPAPPPQVLEPKVEVINTLPAYYAKLYEHHLKVVETSLVPVLELLGRFTGSQAQTRGELESLAGELRAVLAKNRQAGRIELDRRDPQGGP